MKKLLFILALFMPSLVFAAGLTVPQGGTGSTTLTGLIKGAGTARVVTAVNGIDFTLITVKTCNAGDFVSAVTAAGVFTCSTPAASSFSTTSASYFSSVGLAFSTTSTAYYLTQFPPASFSTTSASYFSSLGLAHSTTSTAYQLSQNIIIGNSTSTTAFSTVSSSTNLFANKATTTYLRVNSDISVRGTSNDTQIFGDSAASLFAGGITSYKDISLTPSSGGQYLRLQNSGAGKFAILIPDLLTANRNLSFPDEAGTFALGTGSAGNCASWSTTNTLTTTGSPCGSGGGVTGGTNGMLAAWTSASTLTATGTPTFASFVSTSTATSTMAGALSIQNFIVGTSTTVCRYPEHCTYQATANTSDVAINAAIASLGSAGGTVYIKAGTYTLNAPILINVSGIVLQGQGNNSTIIIAKNSLNDYMVKVNDAALRERLEFRNFKLDGNRTNQTTGGCIVASSTARSTFDTLWLESCYGQALKLTGPAAGGFGYNNTISNNFINNHNVGIEMINNDENQIYANTINSSITYGVYDRQGLQNIHDNVFTGVLYNTGVGIYSEYTVNTSIQGNTFDTMPYEAIYLLCNSVQGQHLVTDNYIFKADNSGAGRAAITVDGCTRNKITNNYTDVWLQSYAYREVNNAPTNTYLADNFFFGTTSAMLIMSGTGSQSFFNNATTTPSSLLYWAQVDATGQMGFNTPTGYGQYFAINGSQKWTVSSNGNVGISTSTPGSLLSVQGVANFTTASSTFYSTGGINLTSGCFAVSGTCITAGSGSVSGGTNGMLTSWTSATTLTATGTPTFAAFYATSSTATSTLLGSLMIGNSAYSGFLLPNSLLGMSSSVNDGLQSYITNTSTGNNASASFVANNDKSTNTSYFVEMGINGSGYSQSVFSSQNANDGFLTSSDSGLVIGTASTTNSLADLRFTTGGTASSSIRMAILKSGLLTIGTTTPSFGLATFATSTGPQIALTDNSAGSAWTFRNAGGTFYLATSTASATSSKAALSIGPNGVWTLPQPMIVSNGGTGLATLTSNGILYGQGTGALAITASSASSILVTSASGIPSLSTTLPAFTLGGSVAGNGQTITGNIVLTNATATTFFATTASSTAFFANNATTTSLGVTNAITQTNTSATSTFSGGISALRFNWTATSTGSQGINLTAGCFSIAGTCLGSTASVKQYPAFRYATSTAWSGTTTIALAPAFVAETWNGVQCFTNTGTLNVAFINVSSRMNLFNASTTVGTVTLSTNNSIAASAKRYVEIGTPASSPQEISCTVSKTLSIN